VIHVTALLLALRPLSRTRLADAVAPLSKVQDVTGFLCGQSPKAALVVGALAAVAVTGLRWRQEALTNISHVLNFFGHGNFGTMCLF
jgi:hypothetical protein